MIIKRILYLSVAVQRHLNTAIMCDRIKKRTNKFGEYECHLQVQPVQRLHVYFCLSSVASDET
jgi:hypothetical protein